MLDIHAKHVVIVGVAILVYNKKLNVDHMTGKVLRHLAASRMRTSRYPKLALAPWCSQTLRCWNGSFGWLSGNQGLDFVKRANMGGSFPVIQDNTW